QHPDRAPDGAMTRGSTALPAALATLAVSAALGAAVAELSRIEVVLAEQRRAASVALAACDACAAEAVAALPVGWDFDPLLAGPDADGAAASDSAGLGAPGDPDALDRWLAGEGARVVSSARTLPALHSPPPPLVALAERMRTAGARGAEALVPTGTPPPSLALVESDLVVSDRLFGAGLLFVDGLLDIRGALDFAGVVVAIGGVRVTGAGRLAIGGALWVGAPAAGGLLLDVAGSLALRQQSTAIAAADRLLALP